MRKIKFIAHSLLALALLLIALRPVYVAADTANITGGTNGPLCNSGGYFLPASVTIASGNTVTFSVPANDPYAGGIQINGFPQGAFVVPRGGSVTTAALTTTVSYHGTWPNALSCIKGSGTITVQASASSPPPSTEPSGSTTPPSTSSTAPSTPPASTSTKSTQQSPATQPAAAPETVVADTITVAGSKVTSIENLQIKQSQPLVLSGHTVANGHITLTIHSNPTTATVQADASGNWSYTVKNLAPGSHTIAATITDPATNQTSASSKLLAFTVAATPTASTIHAAAPTAKKSSSLVLPIAAGVFGLLVIAAAVLLVLKVKKKATRSSVGSPIVATPLAAQPMSQTEQLTSPSSTSTPESTQTPPTPDMNGSDESHKQENG